MKRNSILILSIILIISFSACGAPTPVIELPTPVATSTDAGAQPATTNLPTPTQVVLPTATVSPTQAAVQTQAVSVTPHIPSEPMILYSISTGELSIGISFTVPRGVGLIGIDNGTNLIPSQVSGEQNFFYGTPFTWSPDGSRFVFVTTRNDKAQLYVINTDGTNLILLTDYGNNDSPAWSPDGTKIAFVSRQDDEANIYLINPDGSEMTCLTCDISGNEIFPTWAPDSRSLAYTADGGPAPVYIIELATRVARPVSSPELKASDPVFAPNGQWLAFVCEARICMNTISGQVLGNIVADNAVNTQPDISPDGKQIAFISNRDGNYELYVVNIDNTNLRRLTNTAYPEMHPSWSSDGQWIAFASATIFQESYTNYDLYMIHPNGQNLTQLTNLSTNEFYPLWLLKK